ncbi:ABC transporter substrate-binding protein [Colwelliaceae bacterium 6441]
MTKKLSLFYLLVLLIAIGIALVYLKLNDVLQPKQYQVTIAVSKTPLSSPFYVAKSINAFDKTCVTVNFDEVLGGQIAFAKVMKGEVDFGTSSDSVLAFQSLVEKPFAIHAMFVQSDNDVKLITKTSDKVQSVIDLKGKKVGVTKATASEYFFSTLMATDGLTVNDVKLIHYQPDQLINAFVNNEIDAVVTWEPFVFQGSQRLAKQIKIHDTKNLNTLSFNLVSKKSDILLVEKSKCIIQGLNTAIDFMASHPQKAKEIIMKELKLSTDFINWVWPDYIFKLSLNHSLILNIESQATWFVETQMSEFNTVPNIEKFVDSRAMLQVVPRAVNILQ